MLLLLHHHEQYALGDVSEVWLVQLHLVQQKGQAGVRDRPNICSVLHERVQAIQALVPRRQVVVLDHLLNDRPIYLKWIVRVAVELLFLLQLSIWSLIIDEELINFSEGVQPDLPLRIKRPVLEAHVPEVLVLLSTIKAIASTFSDSSGSVLALVVDVADLVAFSLVQLVDRDVVELGHECLPFLCFGVAIGCREVDCLWRLVVLLEMRWVRGLNQLLLLLEMIILWSLLLWRGLVAVLMLVLELLRDCVEVLGSSILPRLIQLCWIKPLSIMLVELELICWLLLTRLLVVVDHEARGRRRIQTRRVIGHRLRGIFEQLLLPLLCCHLGLICTLSKTHLLHGSRLLVTRALCCWICGLALLGCYLDELALSAEVARPPSNRLSIDLVRNVLAVEVLIIALTHGLLFPIRLIGVALHEELELIEVGVGARGWLSSGLWLHWLVTAGEVDHASRVRHGARIRTTFSFVVRCAFEFLIHHLVSAASERALGLEELLEVVVVVSMRNGLKIRRGELVPYLVCQLIYRVLPIETKRAILLSIQRSLVILGSAELVNTRRCALRDELHLLDRLLHLSVGTLQLELVHVIVLSL